MTRKAAIGISTNAVITLIIAVIVLGILVALVIGWFDKINPPSPDVKAPNPTTAVPVTTAYAELSGERGETVQTSFAVLNGPAAQDITLDVQCGGTLSEVQVNTQTLEPNTIGQYTVLLTISDTAESGVKLCSASAAGIGRTEFSLAIA